MRNLLLILLIFALMFLLPVRNEAQEETIINLEEGNFIIKDLAVTKDRFGFPVLNGSVVNNTAKDWTEVTFEVYLFDRSGNKLRVGILEDAVIVSVYNIKKGEAQSINELLGSVPERINSGGRKKNLVSRFEVRFKEGEYPAKYNFVMVKPKESKELAFEDSVISMQFSIVKSQIGFTLYNKTDNPIKIDWDQVSYVDITGESHKIMHSGVRYSERDKPQAPTVVPPTAKLEDIILPTDYVYYRSGEYVSGWRNIFLFPEGPAAKNYKGRSFSVFMPLEINGVIQNYLFAFKIEDIEM